MSATENYGPTLAADINALPLHIRRYIADLEQRADPAGDVRRAHVAEENAAALARRVEELDALAQHLRYCRECGETDVTQCSDGFPLWDRCFATPPTGDTP